MDVSTSKPVRLHLCTAVQVANRCHVEHRVEDRSRQGCFGQMLPAWEEDQKQPGDLKKSDIPGPFVTSDASVYWNACRSAVRDGGRHSEKTPLEGADATRCWTRRCTVALYRGTWVMAWEPAGTSNSPSPCPVCVPRRDAWPKGDGTKLENTRACQFKCLSHEKKGHSTERTGIRNGTFKSNSPALFSWGGRSN